MAGPGQQFFLGDDWLADLVQGDFVQGWSLSSDYDAWFWGQQASMPAIDTTFSFDIEDPDIDTTDNFEVEAGSNSYNLPEAQEPSDAAGAPLNNQLDDGFFPFLNEENEVSEERGDSEGKVKAGPSPAGQTPPPDPTLPFDGFEEELWDPLFDLPEESDEEEEVDAGRSRGAKAPPPLTPPASSPVAPSPLAAAPKAPFLLMEWREQPKGDGNKKTTKPQKRWAAQDVAMMKTAARKFNDMKANDEFPANIAHRLKGNFFYHFVSEYMKSMGHDRDYNPVKNKWTRDVHNDMLKEDPDFDDPRQKKKNGEARDTKTSVRANKKVEKDSEKSPDPDLSELKSEEEKSLQAQDIHSLNALETASTVPRASSGADDSFIAHSPNSDNHPNLKRRREADAEENDPWLSMQVRIWQEETSSRWNIGSLKRRRITNDVENDTWLQMQARIWQEESSSLWRIDRKRRRTAYHNSPGLLMKQAKIWQESSSRRWRAETYE